MSNSFSTLPSVTSLCTKISGRPGLSISDLRKLKLSAGPGMKYSLPAMPYHHHNKRYHHQSFYLVVMPQRKNRRTISSCSVAAFALPVPSVLSDIAPALSLNELIARLSRSPMVTASPGYGAISGVRLVYLPGPTTHSVVARDSEIPAPRPTHPTVPHS